jgi:hypothetical protein
MTNRTGSDGLRVEHTWTVVGLLVSTALLLGCGREAASSDPESTAQTSEALSGDDAGGAGAAGGSSVADVSLELKVLTNSCGSNQAQDFFEVTNTGSTSANLSDIALKFWVYDTSGQNVLVHVWTGGCVSGVGGNPSCVHQVSGVAPNVTPFAPACGPSPTEQANWEITITDADGAPLPPGATWSNIQTNVNLANYGNFSPGTADWFSPCLSGSSYTTSTKFALYYQGRLLYSSGQTAPSCRVPDSAMIQAFIDSRYMPADVVHTFTSVWGETVDCVNFFAEPGVRALAAAGQPITQVPRLQVPQEILAQLSSPDSGAPVPLPFDGLPDPSGNARTCPEGSIPELRITVDDIQRAGGLPTFFQARNRKLPPTRPSGGDAPQFGHVQVESKNLTALGGGATLSIAAPPITSGQHSLAQIWFGSGSAVSAAVPGGTGCSGNSCFQTIEVGWTEDESVNTDNSPHLFTFATNNGYVDGCYDNIGSVGTGAWDCIAWVPNNSSNVQFAQGMSLATYDPLPGSTVHTLTPVVWPGSGGYEIILVIDNSMASVLGYYPYSDYAAPLAQGATFFNAGAEVNDTNASNTICPFGNPPSVQMGMGTIGCPSFGFETGCASEPQPTGPLYDSFLYDYFYLDDTMTRQYPVLNFGASANPGFVFSTCPRSFAWTGIYGSLAGAHNMLYYGDVVPGYGVSAPEALEFWYGPECFSSGFQGCEYCDTFTTLCDVPAVLP